MTEAEFRALLKLENRSIRMLIVDAEEREEIMVMVCDDDTHNMMRFQIAKTYDEALNRLMKRYYENN